VTSSLLSISLAETASIDEDILLTTTNYEKLYNDLLKENTTLKIENKKQEAELISLKLSVIDYVQINDCLKKARVLYRKNCTLKVNF